MNSTRMTKSHRLKIFLTSIALFQTINGHALGPEFLSKASGFLGFNNSKEKEEDSIVNILNNVMANINKDVKIYGPVYRHHKRDEDKYGDEVVKIILNSAHAKAKKYLDEGNPQAYYAFMTLALTVPNQEGLFVHFRDVKAQQENCNDDRANGNNIGSNLAKSKFKLFLNAVPEVVENDGVENEEESQTSLTLPTETQGPTTPFLVSCDKLEGEKRFRQLIVGGSDGSDVGMFQLSALWHYEEFLAKGKYDSVKQTVDYGLSYLRNQFNHALRNAPTRFTCFLDKNEDIDYIKLIRGSWSAYNGGPSQKCRFADEEGPYAGHDRGFKKNLQITLDLNDGGFFGFADDSKLKLSRDIRSAVEEIVTNLEQKTNVNKSLKKVLDEA